MVLEPLILLIFMHCNFISFVKMDYISALNIIARLPPAESDAVVSDLCMYRFSPLYVIIRCNLSKVETIFGVKSGFEVAAVIGRVHR